MSGAVRRLLRSLFDLHPVLDLHGLGVKEARAEIERFLSHAVAAGETQVRIVYGKGRGTPGGIGVLRSVVPGWLANECAPWVERFERDLDSSGDDGAVRVWLPARWTLHEDDSRTYTEFARSAYVFGCRSSPGHWRQEGESDGRLSLRPWPAQNRTGPPGRKNKEIEAMKRAFGTALLVGTLAFGMVSAAWSAGAAAGDQGASTTSTTGTKKHTKKHAKKHSKSKSTSGSTTSDTTKKE